ncbi:MAG: PAS domain S-box protein [Magnetococcales bacterium]|nr:PAS domain S-box protein [Magnetococcales bacterium]
MIEGIKEVSQRQDRDIRESQARLVERSLQMRCLAYMANAKAQLLSQTIVEIGTDKEDIKHLRKVLQNREDLLAEREAALLNESQKLEHLNLEKLQRSNYFFQAFGIGVSTVALVLLLILYGWFSFSRIDGLQKGWEESHQDTSERAQILFQLKSSLGYGGFIHHFKNYLLRQTSGIELKIQHDLETFARDINRYARYPLIEEEREALEVLRQVFARYVAAFEVVKQEIGAGTSPAEIDRLVKIDDQPALQAVDLLTHHVSLLSQQHEKSTRNRFQETVDFIWWGVLLVPILLAIGTILILFLKRTMDTNRSLYTARTQLESILDTAPNAIFSLDVAGKIVRANKKALALSGYSPDQLQGLPFQQLVEGFSGLVTSSTDEMSHQKRKEAFIKQHDYVLQARSGKAIPIDLSYDQIRVEEEVFGTVIIRDISEHKQAEEALKESEQRFRRAVMGAPYPIMLHAEDGEVILISEAWTELSGYAPEEIRTVSEWVNKAYGLPSGSLLTGVENPFEIEQLTYGGEFKIQTASGKMRLWDFSTAPLGRLADGRQAVISMASDVTERKQAELELQKLRRAIEQSPVTVIITDQTGNIEYVNPAFSQLTGFEQEEVLGKKPAILKSGHHPDIFYQQMWQTILSGEVWRGEIHNRSKHGRFWWEDATIAAVSDEAGKITHFVGIKVDITERKQAIKELHASEAKLKVITENTPDAVILLDHQGGVSFWNRGAEDIFGYAREEVLGKDLHTLLVPSRYDSVFRKNFPHFQQSGQGAAIGQAIELTALHREGHEFPVELSVGAVQFDGEWCAIGIVRDISLRKESEQELMEVSNTLQLATKASRIGIWEWDLADNRLKWDDQMRELYGISDQREGHLYKDWRNAIHPDDIAAAEQSLQNCLNGVGAFDAEYRIRLEDQTIRHLQSSAIVERDREGRPIRLIGINRDITSMRAQEMMLKEAKEEAEKATQAKSEFLARMSHEIRTPMNAIMGLSHLVLRSELTHQQRDHLDKVQMATRSLLGIINDILDFSKIEAGKLDIEQIPFSLDEVFSNVTNIAAFFAEEKSLELLVHIKHQTPTALIGDPLRLEQVLLNLTNNAIKFTEQGEVELYCRLVEQKGDQVQLQFSVRDTGIGISGEEQSKLFHSFSQADGSTSRRFGGTGLGLVISQRLVELLGGEPLAVKSQPGEGSRFSFYLSFRVQEGALNQVDRWMPPVYMQGMQVLVVDDNPLARDIFKSALDGFGFGVTTLSSGEEAVALFNDSLGSSLPYQLVLMDWKMGGIDGIEATRIIKINRVHPPPFIILVTAHGREEAVKRASSAGVDLLLTKPINRSALFNGIMALFGHQAGADYCSISDQLVDAATLKQIYGRKVLVVEDNLINQEVAQKILEDAGLIVSLADNGCRAMEMLAAQPFDAVLMDIHMPQMDGYETTRVIRETAGLDALPVIALTANALKEEESKCRAAGMNDYVSKPIDVAHLYTTLARWIEGPPVVSSLPLGEESQEEDIDLILELPDFDLKSGLKRLGGSRKLLWTLLKKFRLNHLESGAHLDRLVEQEDFAALFKLVHTIKGVAANLGGVVLAESARRLEGVVDGGDRDLIVVEKNKFKQDLEQTIEAILTLEEGGGSPPAEGLLTEREGVVASAELGQTVITIYRLLSENSLEVERHLPVLKSHLVAMGLAGDYEALESEVLILDFEKAMERLVRLAESMGVIVK